MVCLDGIETTLAPFGDARIDRCLARMCERRQPAGAMNGGNDLRAGGTFTRDERGTSLRQPSVECFGDGGDVPRTHHRASDERTAKGTAGVSPGVGNERLDVDRQIECGELLGYGHRAVDTPEPLLCQERSEVWGVLVDEVAENVNIASVLDRRDLDAAHGFDGAGTGQTTNIRGGQRGVVIGDRHHDKTSRGRTIDEFRRRQTTVGNSCVKVEIDQLTAGGGAVEGRSALCPPPLTFHEGTVFTNEQVEMLAFLIRELEEYLLALGVLEPFSVLLEELMGPALAANTNHERLLIIDALAQPLCTFSEDAARRPFEIKERRASLELRIAEQQFRVPLLQTTEMRALFLGKILEYLPAAGVLRALGRTQVELGSTPLGRNGNTQRITGEDQV